MSLKTILQKSHFKQETNKLSIYDYEKFKKPNSELIEKRWKAFADKYGLSANTDVWERQYFIRCIKNFGINCPDEEIYEEMFEALPF